MSLRSKFVVTGTTVLLATSTLSLAGCTSAPAPTVTHVDQVSADDTTTLTPLERGEERREVLDTLQAGIDAWIANDPETMRLYFGDNVMRPFESAWADFDEQGLTVVHVQEPIYFDVTEFNRTGTQALVTYRYDDDSYLVDSGGAKVEDLEPLSDNDIQFTAEKQDDGSWLAVRIIGSSLR